MWRLGKSAILGLHKSLKIAYLIELWTNCTQYPAQIMSHSHKHASVKG